MEEIKRAERKPDQGEVEMVPGKFGNERVTYVKERTEEEAESEIISQSIEPVRGKRREND